ncbi:retrovirus-related pol polyprotein from transposon TNT 1-94 [Tanacetum coccineum]
MTIEESKDLSSLALDELIGNLKTHEIVMEKDSKIYKGKKEKVKSIALKAKKESSDDETSTSESDDEQYDMADEKKGKNDRKCFGCGDLNHRIGDCPKPSRNKDQKAFIEGSWSDNKNDAEDKTDDETCLMAQSSNEVCLRTCLEPDEWIKDSGCSKHMTSNKSLFSTYKAYNGANDVWDLIPLPISQSVIETKWFFRNKLDENGIVSRNKARLVAQGYNQQEGIDYDETYAPVAKLESIRILLAIACANNFKLYQIDVKCAFLNGFINEEVYVAQPLGFIDFQKPDYVYKLKNALYGLKQAPKACSLRTIVGIKRLLDDLRVTVVAKLKSIRILLAIACANNFKLYQIDVKCAFLNGFINEEVYIAQPPGFIDFQKPDYVYKLKNALYGLKQAPKAWYDRLKAFLIKHEYSMRMVDNTLFTKKSKSHLIIVQIYVDDIIFGSTSQNLCDDFAKIMHDEFKISMMRELNFFLGLQIKQIEDKIFFNQAKYIKEMLKKFELKDSKPTKTPMSTKIKLTKDDEANSMDSSKYQGMIGCLLYLTTSRPDIMFSVCLCARFQENPKTTNLEAVKRIFRYVRGTTHLGLWYPKGTGVETIKQKALAISTTEAEYVSAGKACQQALWMKQALIDYDIRLDEVPIMCDNKGDIDLSKKPYRTL